VVFTPEERQAASRGFVGGLLDGCLMTVLWLALVAMFTMIWFALFIWIGWL
jgi:hypothetical protein